MIDRSGQQIDRYRLLRRIGGGGYGDVYLAEDMLHNKQIALKILRELDVSFAVFFNEARIALLRHPHIVPNYRLSKVYDIGESLVVMEYMPGGTLRNLHPHGTQVPLRTVVSYMKQIAAALDYAHSEDWVHRDVKPENILVGPNETILLSDFGIATTSSTVNPELIQDAVGTWLYMAPEQMQREAVRASDLYALAVIAYKWLAGIPPFLGRTWQELAHKHRALVI